MSSEDEDIAIRLEGVSKRYEIYDAPRDRLKQFLLPSLGRLIGRSPKLYFREFWALKGISLEIKRGETVGVIGRNGSGKSTLLQIICGTVSATDGVLETTGRIAALLELGSGFSPEFSGRENVYMYAAILGLSRRDIDDRFEDIIDFAEIGEHLDQPVKNYSSGMQMRLAFAVAINVDPEILIVDEALSVGDELFQRKCFSRIEKIKKKGATILFVSHSGGAVIELCDRAILLDSGELISQGLPKAIVGGYQKLLYAPPDAQQEIKNSLKSIKIAEQAFSEALVAPGKNGYGEAELKNGLVIAEEVEEYFDENLMPTSTIDYESQGARVGIPAIFTQEGRRVNNLRSGHHYRYIYEVEFDRDCFDVRFGMLIKAMNGTNIGGLGTAKTGGGIRHMRAGSVVQVSFDFNCIALPGQYFTNVGCSGRSDGEDTFLHRIVDVATFKVLPNELLEARTGYVDIAVASPCFRIKRASA